MKSQRLSYYKILLFILSINPIFGNSQTDREFWFVAPEITLNHTVAGGIGGQPIFLAFTTTDLAADVTISMPANPTWVDTVVHVPAYSSRRWDMTHRINQIENQWIETTKGINNKGFHITSNTRITAYYEVSNQNNPDIWSLKGKNALGTEFFLSFQTRMYNVNDYYSSNPGYTMPAYSAADIVATMDGTIITIEIPPDKGLYWGYTGAYFTDTTVTVPLDLGETFSCIPAHLHDPDTRAPAVAWKTTDNTRKMGRAAEDHLAGVRVTSNYDIAISLKDDSMKSYAGGCYDLAGDQTVPTRLLGTEYIAMKGQLNDNWSKPTAMTYGGGGVPLGNWYDLPAENNVKQETIYITATDDNTRVKINGAYVDTLDRGETMMWEVVNNITLVESEDSAVYVWQISGWGCEMGGAVLPTTSFCTGSTQVGFTRSTTEEFFLNIMVRKAAKDSFKFNGAYHPMLDGSVFTDIAGSDWAAARIGSINTATIPVGAQSLISNTRDVFHLGVINGGAGSGTRFGYFSDYNPIEISSFIVNSGSGNVRLCYGDSAQIEAIGGIFYYWQPGDYLTDSTSRTPMAYPPYSVTYLATVTGACDTTAYTQVSMSVSTPLEIRFAIDTPFLCAPDTVWIHDQSFGVTTFTWDMGDGTIYVWNSHDTIVNDTTFFHVYQNTTDSIEHYTIIVKAENSDMCVQYDSAIVTVYPEPEAQFMLNDSIGCHPLGVTFNNQSINTSYYQWFFGDGASSLQEDPFHSFLNTGPNDVIYETMLIASELYGTHVCKDTNWFSNITVHPYVEVAYTVDPIEACAPYDADFSPLLMNTDSLKWSFQYPTDSFITDDLINQTHTYNNLTNNPTYPVVRLEGWNNDGGRACGDVWIDTLTIYPEVHAIFNMDNDSVCDDDSISIVFTNSSTGYALQYMWDFGGTGSDTATNPAARLFENKTSASITYPITLTATTQAWLYCSHDTSHNLVVHPYINAEFDISDALLTCHDFTTTFTNLTNRGSTYIWSSTFDPSLDTIVDNTLPFDHTYSNLTPTIQTDIVTLISINAEGCNDTVSKSLQIYPTVISRIEADIDTGCHPKTIEFHNTSYPELQIESYSWNFGDSTSYSSFVYEEYVDHPFSNFTDNLATYPVILTVRNIHACEHKDTVNIYVAPYLEAGFHFNDGSKCHPRTLLLEGSCDGSIAINGYSWNYRDGDRDSNSTYINTTHTFINPSPATQNDTFNVMLTVSNTHAVPGPGGRTIECRDVITKPVVVFPEIFASFTPPSQGCTPLSVTFTNQSSPGSKYFYWDFGDNTYDTTAALSTQLTHLFENETTSNYTFPVHLRAVSENSLCEDDTTINITVYGFILPSIKIDDPTVCHGVPMHLYDQSVVESSGSSAWQFGSGGYYEYPTDDIYHTFTNTTETPQTFNITLSVQNSMGCDASTTHSVTIYPEVRAAFDSILPGCHPMNRTINNKTNALSGLNLYEWKFGDGGTSINEDPSHIFVNYGYTDRQYTVELRATSEYDCVDSAQQVVDVYHVPLAKMFVPSNIACTPFPVTYTNQSRSADATYYWDFDWNGTVDTTTTQVSQQVSYDFENLGSGIQAFTSRLEAYSTHNCFDFDTLTIQVFPGVSALFDPDTTGCSPFTYIPVNHSINAENHDWVFTDGSTVYRSTVPEPTQILTNKTNHDVTYTVILNASSESGCAGVDTHYVTVYPKPRTGFTISSKYNTWEPDITIQFYNQSDYITRYGYDHPIDYNWSFGDNSSEVNNDATVPHTYSTFSHNEEDRSFVIILTGVNTEHPQCNYTTIDTIYMEPPLPELYVTTYQDIIDICQPGYITFIISDTAYVDPTIENPVTWNFDDGNPPISNNQFSMTHYFEIPKIHKVQVTLRGYGNNNTNTILFPVTIHPKPTAEFDVVPRTVSLPDNAQVRCYNYSEGAATYEWRMYGLEDDVHIAHDYEPYYDYNDQYANPGDTVYITLISYSDFGCCDTATDVQGVAIVGKGLLEYPLAFDPSNPNEGFNEFKPYMADEEGGIIEYEMWIYNRWGEMVFHSTNPDKGWDGTVNGKECKMDVYVYKVQAKFSSGKSFFSVADVTLIR